MSSEKEGNNFITGYGIKNAKIVSDKKRQLYKAFGLSKGKLKQLFNKASIARSKEAKSKGHHISFPKGNVFQMPGVFLVSQGSIVKEFRHKHAGEVPDYVDMSTCPISY